MRISPRSHIENFYFIFQWLAYIKYECFLQELEMACVFAIKISIYIVCQDIWTLTILATQYLVWCPLRRKKGRKSGQTVWVYFTTFSIKVSRKAFPPDGKVWLVHKTWLIGLTKSLASFKSGRLTFFPFSAAFATEKKIRKIIRKQYCISETRED